VNHSRKINDLIRMIKTYSQVCDLDAASITTAAMVLLYELAICKAALTQKTPSEQLAEFIQILEESFGEFLQDHAEYIARINALGDSLMGRR
jgi:cell division protein ZapA (FtsZ GTPase activity inhibitor)